MLRTLRLVSTISMLALVVGAPLLAQGQSDMARVYHAPQGGNGGGHLMSVPLAATEGHLNHGDNRVCFNEKRCIFDGLTNVFLGNAALRLNGAGNLIVSNIGSSGLDGVRQDPLPSDSFQMITGIECPNFVGSAEGTRGVFIMYADVPGDVFSVYTVENVGPGPNGVDVIRAEADFSPIGATTYTLQVFNGEDLVGEVNGLKVGEVTFAKTDIREIDCTIDGRITTEITFPDIVTVAATGEKFFGDRFCFMAEDATETATTQTAIDNFLTNTGPVEMTFQFAGPLGGRSNP